MATRRRRGEDGISFEHRGPCRDPQRHRHCPGLWRGEITLGYTGDANAPAAKSAAPPRPPSSTSSATCTTSSTRASPPRPADTQYTVRQAASDWLAHGPDGRSPKTIKNQNVLQPILTVIGARKLRDLTAADVRQALAVMAAGYSTAAVTMGHLALKRAIRHAEASDLVAATSPPWPTPPKASTAACPSKSLTLDQASVITAARTLPVMELRPALRTSTARPR